MPQESAVFRGQKEPIVGIHLTNTVHVTWMRTDDYQYSVGYGTLFSLMTH